MFARRAVVRMASRRPWLSDSMQKGAMMAEAGVDDGTGTGSGERGELGDGIVLIYSTCPDEAAGKAVARALVEARLAACVNMIPGMTALYHWKGEVAEDAEVVLIIKTRAGLVDAAIALGCDVHPYETPAFVPIKAEGGAAGYLAWLLAETGG